MATEEQLSKLLGPALHTSTPSITMNEAQGKSSSACCKSSSDVNDVKTNKIHQANLCKLEQANIEQDVGRKFVNKHFHHYRFLVVVFGGLSVGMMFLLRYNVTISVLKMVNQTYIYMEEHPNGTVDQMLDAGLVPGGEFDWNNEIQQMIMSWYMVSYTLPQIPMTRLGTMIGCRWAMYVSLLVCSFATIFTPLLAHCGWQYVIMLRMLNGLGAAAIQPLLLSLLEAWLNYEEISLGLSISQTISTLSMALNPIMASYLCDIHWSLSFYVPGLAALLFGLLWLLLISDSPETSWLVSERELAHIRGSRASSDSNKERTTGAELKAGHSDERPDTWLRVFRVPSYYAFIIIWCLHNCSYNGFTFILPTYLIQFLKVAVTENGLFCSIIQSGSILAVMWPHPLLRALQTEAGLSNIASRRVAITVCCSVLAITWLLVGLFHQHQLLLLFINRCAQNGVDVIVTSTLMLNYARVGLSSIAFSAVNTFGNLSVVLSSTFIGWLLDYTASSELGWSCVFGAFAATQLLLWTLFCTCISSEPVRFVKAQPVAAN